jgi:hypothetical protein
MCLTSIVFSRRYYGVFPPTVTRAPEKPTDQADRRGHGIHTSLVRLQNRTFAFAVSVRSEFICAVHAETAVKNEVGGQESAESETLFCAGGIRKLRVVGRDVVVNREIVCERWD